MWYQTKSTPSNTAMKNLPLNTPERILLAEDNALEAELVLCALAPYRLADKVDVASNGLDVLNYLHKLGGYEDRKEGYPDLILLDIQMPVMNGIEVLRRIKMDNRLKAIPVFMLTSSKTEQDIVESYKLGANAYVLKSCNAEVLGDTIIKLFSTAATKEMGSF